MISKINQISISTERIRLQKSAKFWSLVWSLVEVVSENKKRSKGPMGWKFKKEGKNEKWEGVETRIPYDQISRKLFVNVREDSSHAAKGLRGSYTTFSAREIDPNKTLRPRRMDAQAS